MRVYLSRLFEWTVSSSFDRNPIWELSELGYTSFSIRSWSPTVAARITTQITMERISCQNSNMQSFDSNRPSFDSNMQSFDSNRQTFDSNRQTFNPSIQTFNPSLQSFAPIQTRHPLSSWSFVVSTIIRLFRRSSSLPSFVSFVIRRSLGSSSV